MAALTMSRLFRACALSFCSLVIVTSASANCAVTKIGKNPNEDVSKLIDGQTVICDGNPPNPFTAGPIEPEQDNIFGITVTLRDNAEYNDRILLFDQSKILLSGTSKITSFVTAIRVISNKFFNPGNDKPPQPRKPSSISLSGSSAIKADIGIDLSGDAPSTISLSGSSKIQATTAAIKVSGEGDRITLSDQAALQATTAAIKVSGEGDRITLSDQAALSSNFQGIIISGVDSTKNTVELGGKTSIQVSGPFTSGIFVEGSANAIRLSSTAAITANGGSPTQPSRGVVLLGNNDTLTMQDSASIIGSGLGSFGVQVLGNQDSVTLNVKSSIVQNAAPNNGGDPSSVGVVLGGTGNTLTLNDTSLITSPGWQGIGVLVTGSGDVINVSKNAAVTTTNRFGTAISFNSPGNTLINAGTVSSTGNPPGFGSSTINGSAGADTVINRGFIINGNDQAIILWEGDDKLTLDTGSFIVGRIDGGSGTNSLLLNGSGTDNNRFLNWTSLTMDGVDWSLGGNSTFGKIAVKQGNLSINGTEYAPGGVTLARSGSLGGNGTLIGKVIDKGKLDPGNSVGDLHIVGSLVQQGGGYEVQFDSHGIDRQDVSGTAELLADPLLPGIEVVALGGSTGASGVILKADGGITGSFGAIDYAGNGAATVNQTATTVSLVTLDGTSAAASGFAGIQTGLDFLESLAGEQIAGLSGCHGACLFDEDAKDHHLWAQGFGRFYQQDAADGNQDYAYRVAGGTVGGDMGVSDGLRLGGSFGYANTAVSLADDAGDTGINSALGAIYANYQAGRYFVTGALSGGWQGYDRSRVVTVNNLQRTAQADSDGWLLGASLQAGMCLCKADGWSFVPSLGVDYQHQWVDGYSEQGGGAAGVSMNSQSSDAVRLRAQARVGKDFLTEDLVVTPHLNLGVIEQFTMGGTATGNFANGEAFGVSTIDGDRTIGDLGAGVDVNLRNGVALYVNYDAQVWGGGYNNAVIGGLRMSW